MKWIVAILAALFLMLNTGCTITTKNDGGFYIRFSQGIEAGHTAKDTHSEAESELSSQPLLDYLAKKDVEKPTEPTP